MNKIIPLTLASIFALNTTGCTVVGEDEFSCPNPEKGVCVDAKTAYEFAEDSEKVAYFENRNGSYGNDETETNGNSISRDYSGSSQAKNTLRDVAPVAGIISKPIYNPKPVITQAQVLRVWVNTYEDSDGVLHMPQTSYVEITPRKWALGKGGIDKRHKSTSPFTLVGR